MINHEDLGQKSLFYLPKSESISPFESNIDFEIRFMADRDIVGCGWLEAQKGKYKYISTRTTYCQLEVMLTIS